MLALLPYGDRAYPAGFPHSEIHGSKPAFDSPWHIADCCVLRRLLVPRHSPCALCSLTIFESLVLLVKETLDDNLNCSCYPKINFTFLLLHICLHCSVFKVHHGCLRIPDHLSYDRCHPLWMDSSHTPLLAYVVLVISLKFWF